MTEVHLDPQAGAEPSGGAEAIGLELRRAREARGETPGDVALALKLTGRQVEAMEAGRLELLPGAAFARGFLRNYARYLGLDPVALLAGLDAEKAARAVDLAPVSNAEVIMPSGGGRSVRVPAILSAIGLVMLIGGWYFDWFRMPQESESAVESAAPAPQIIAPSTSDSASPAVPADAPAAAPSVTPAVPVPPAATAALPPASVSPVAPPAPAAIVPAAPAAPAPAPAPTPAPIATPVAHADGLQQLVFHFEGDAWIEVRDASGSIVFSGISQAGSSRTVQGRPPFALVVGNARQVALEYRGKPYDLLPHVRVSVARLTLE